MRFSDYRGSVLIAVAAIAALWLAATGQLVLYIHPRYIIFTVVFSAIAVLGTVIGMRYMQHADDDGGPRRVRLTSIVVTAVCLCAVYGLLINEPAALTSATANQRGMNAAVSSSGGTAAPAYAPLFANNDYSSFTIKDWTSLLAQTDDPEFFRGKNVSILGFVVADKTDPDMFYISRFLVTCCAVDGRALGLPVHAPGWRERFAEDDWMQLRGTFIANPNPSDSDPVVIRPEKMEKTGRPESVYVY